MMMRHLDLFSGIGGFALAASWVWGEDHEIVSFCEIEDYPQKVLAKHWPDVPCHGDIKTLKGDSFGAIDLITGGFPCQPFSVAGKQGGSSDDRHLWPEMFRVIQEAKPTWIIGENVAGLVNMVEFEQCFLDLESEGYETQPFIIPACATDAKHRRDRVWIVANNDGKYCGASRTGEIQRRSAIKTSTASEQSADVANTDNKPRLQTGKTSCSIGVERDARNNVSGGRRESQPRVSRWAVEPSVGRVANGIPSRVDRLKGLGNAIVPQCVVPIMQSIKEITCPPKQST